MMLSWETSNNIGLWTKTSNFQPCLCCCEGKLNAPWCALKPLWVVSICSSRWWQQNYSREETGASRAAFPSSTSKYCKMCFDAMVSRNTFFALRHQWRWRTWSCDQFTSNENSAFCLDGGGIFFFTSQKCHCAGFEENYGSCDSHVQWKHLQIILSKSYILQKKCHGNAATVSHFFNQTTNPILNHFKFHFSSSHNSSLFFSTSMLPLYRIPAAAGAACQEAGRPVWASSSVIPFFFPSTSSVLSSR